MRVQGFIKCSIVVTLYQTALFCFHVLCLNVRLEVGYCDCAVVSCHCFRIRKKPCDLYEFVSHQIIIIIDHTVITRTHTKGEYAFSVP